VSKFAADWKKAKSFNFGKEPLSDALKALDTAVATFEKTRTRENLAALGGAAKSAVRANAETLKIADPKKHPKMNKYLTDFGKRLDFMSDSVTKWQRDLAAFMQESQKRRTVIVKALTTSASKPSPQLAQTGLKQAQEYGAWLNKSAKDFFSPEIELTAQMAAKATLLLKEMSKTIADDTDQKKDFKLKEIAKEMKTLADRLSQPAKMIGVKFQGETRALG